MSAIYPIDFIRVSDDGSRFVREQSGQTFTPWGFNYDHDSSGRLIEDYWHDEWDTVVGDFREMKALGANTVRIHLQTGRFMQAPDRPNRRELKQLAQLVSLAEETGLYLDITGLGCYHKQDLPGWYDPLPEQERWEVQAKFWEAVAEVCAESPALFCYDLMNEPILPGAKSVEADWLSGELGGKYFVQRISLDLAGRSRQEVARAWVDRLMGAVRTQDERHMITVGAIPWAMFWSTAKPFFYSEQVGKNLDFVSVHFYPKSGEVEKALAALSVYEVGKPILIEEMFPLRCNMEELAAFIHGSRGIADGWIGFYWGTTIEEYERKERTLGEAITASWLKFFKSNSIDIIPTQF